MGSEYEAIKYLKRLDKKILSMFSDLENHKDGNSKNILIICRNKKDCKEAIKHIANNYLGRCEIHMASLKIKIDDTTFIFTPISDIKNYVIGTRYSQYYMDDEI